MPRFYDETEAFFIWDCARGKIILIDISLVRGIT